ncbi:MAG: Crp/Fnr family transcriptional regulator [Verrucomicrobiales bacterium]
MADSFTTPEIPDLGIMSALTAEHRRLLSNYGEFLPVQAEQSIIQEGEEQNSLYFVISGLLHVHSQTSGKNILLARIEPGETLGEVNLFDPTTASASVTAKEFSQVWKAVRADLEDFMSEYPDAAAQLLIQIGSSMSKRIRIMNEKLTMEQLKRVHLEYWA